MKIFIVIVLFNLAVFPNCIVEAMIKRWINRIIRPKPQIVTVRYRPHAHLCAMAENRIAAISRIAVGGMYKVGVVNEDIVGVVYDNKLRPFVDSDGNWFIVSIHDMESLTTISNREPYAYAFFDDFHEFFDPSGTGTRQYSNEAILYTDGVEAHHAE